MKLAGVRTSNGESVTLLFADAGVYVLDRSSHRSRLFRISGTAIFAAIALAAASIGVGHTVNVSLGLWLSAGALLLGAGSAAVGAAAWFMAAASERRSRAGAPAITVQDVRWARSADVRGLVSVSLGLSDDATCEFRAPGMTGAHLAGQFSAMLGIENTPATPVVADAAG